MGIINANGYNTFYYEDILQEKIEYLQKFIPAMSLSDSNPIMILLKESSLQDEQLSQAGLELYNSRSVMSSSGRPLEKLVSVLQIYRKSPTPSTGEVTFFGEYGVLIPSGTQVLNEVGNVYVTTSNAIINENGQINVQVISTTYGYNSRTGENTINRTASPIEGVTRVNNQQAITGGDDEETDAELRLRWFDNLNNLGRSTITSIENRVKSVENVTSVKIIENTSHETDEEGRPAHSFETYVLGGDDADIFKAIVESRAGGILPYGEKSQLVDGYISAFSRVKTEQVTFSVRLYTRDGIWTPDMEDKIKDNIVESFQYLDIGSTISFSSFLNGIYESVGYAISKFDEFSFTVHGDTYGIGDEVVLDSGHIASIVKEDINITYGGN